MCSISREDLVLPGDGLAQRWLVSVTNILTENSDVPEKQGKGLRHT